MTTTPISFSKFLVKIEDPANPGQFKAPCGFMSRSLKIDPDIVERTTPDCDDEEAFVYTERSVQTLSMEVSGEGTLHQDDVAMWRKFRLANQSWNCQVVHDIPGAVGGGMWSGKFVMGPWEQTGERKNHLMFNMNLLSDGKFEWTTAA
jgi:hypothetical protein